jgi:hypothetical protein
VRIDGGAVEHAVSAAMPRAVDAAAQVAVDVGAARPAPSTSGGPVSASIAIVCECVATYITPSISSGWLDALAELSRLRFHTGASLLHVGRRDLLASGVWRCCAPAHAVGGDVARRGGVVAQVGGALRRCGRRRQ